MWGGCCPAEVVPVALLRGGRAEEGAIVGGEEEGAAGEGVGAEEGDDALEGGERVFSPRTDLLPENPALRVPPPPFPSTSSLGCCPA